jgi:hypothetical protein
LKEALKWRQFRKLALKRGIYQFEAAEPVRFLGACVCRSHQRKSKKEVTRRSLPTDVHVPYQIPIVVIVDARLPPAVDRPKASFSLWLKAPSTPGISREAAGAHGHPSAGRFLPVQDQRPAHGAQVVKTSLYKVRTAPCIRKHGPQCPGGPAAGQASADI